MSSLSVDNLSRDKIRQLLCAIGSTPTEDTAQIEATDYDWHQPHYFSSSQLKKLNSFTKTVAAAIAEKFAELYHGDFNVTITSITQHFAGDLLDEISNSEQNDYYLGFGPEQRELYGLVGVPSQTAVAWGRELLGDAGPEKDAEASASPESSPKRLSQFEESLLLDIASATVQSLSMCLYSDSPEYNLQPSSRLIKGRPPIEPPSIEEICKIVFGIAKADTAPRLRGDKSATAEAGDKSTVAEEAYLLLPCRVLVPVVGKSREADQNLTAQDISKAMFNHVYQMPVSVEAQLAQATLTFEQLMSLRPCDVLLLDKAIDEPVELIVDGRTIFRGQPAKSAGQHAVVITELSADIERDINQVRSA